jgi:hypothetical protein
LKGFAVFLSVFVSLYSGLHLYLWLKIRQALNLGGMAGALFLLAMITAPVLIRVFERNGFEALARNLAAIGYTWMGLLLLFVSISV